MFAAEPRHGLTVRLLEASAGTTTTELLGLAAAGIGNEKGAVVRQQEVLDLLLALLVNVLLVVSHKALSHRLAHRCESRKTQRRGVGRMNDSVTLFFMVC